MPSGVRASLPEFVAEGDVAKIILSCGRQALIDSSALPRVRPYAWRTHATMSATAHDRHEYIEAQVNGKRTRLHSFLMGAAPQPGLCVCHKNGDRMDYRLNNLCWATQAQVNANSKPPKGKRYKWVNKAGKKFEARVANDVIGLYDTEDEAAIAANGVAAMVYGSFARLNEVPGILGQPTEEIFNQADIDSYPLFAAIGFAELTQQLVESL